MGGKGRVFRCRVIEFDYQKYVDSIISEYPEKKVSEIAYVQTGQIIIVKMIDQSDLVDFEYKIHLKINGTNMRQNRLV